MIHYDCNIKLRHGHHGMASVCTVASLITLVQVHREINNLLRVVQTMCRESRSFLGSRIVVRLKTPFERIDPEDTYINPHDSARNYV